MLCSTMQQCSFLPAQLLQQQAVQAASDGAQPSPVPQPDAARPQRPATASAVRAESPACQQPTTPAPALRQPTHSSTSRATRPSAAASTVASSQSCASAACPAASGSTHALRSAHWRTLHTFVNCVCRSPLLKSALLSVELGSRHPGTDGVALPTRGGALGWTLAQLLALHVRARLPSASESSILASLWLLESLHDADRSSATASLTAYLEGLGAFCPLAVATLSLDWPTSFCRMRAGLVAAQRDMLSRLNWRLRLDPIEDVLPCYRLLFPEHRRAVPEADESSACSQGACLHGACWHRYWGAAMQGLQGAILEQVQLVQRGWLNPLSCLAEEPLGRLLPESDALPSPSSCRPAKVARTGL